MTQRPSPTSQPGEHEKAFERLYQAHHRQVLAYCARRASRHDAWDAASEVFVVALRRLHEMPPHEEQRAWLLGVAYRVLANQRRTARRRQRLQERAQAARVDPPSRPDELLVRTDEANRVVEALGRLRPPDREIIQLTLWEELTPTEISQVLGISRAAVDQRYYRAKRRLGVLLSRGGVPGTNATQTTTEKGGAA